MTSYFRSADQSRSEELTFGIGRSCIRLGGRQWRGRKRGNIQVSRSRTYNSGETRKTLRLP